MGLFDGLGRALARAFREGLDEETHGAPTELLLEILVLAARADGAVEEEERARMRRLLARHWSQFSGSGSVEDALAEAERRVDARGERALEEVAAALVSLGRRPVRSAQGRLIEDSSPPAYGQTRGPRAREEAYSLALAVLLATRGLESTERPFADALRDALGLDFTRARELEEDLVAASRTA
jgi:uncharacterized membrane protein YebE (DUF533 family)